MRLSRAWAPLLIAVLCLAGESALPADSTPPAPTGSGTLGDYLAAHQDDLAPFFNKNGAALVKDSFPILMGLAGKIALGVLVAGWFIDVLLARGFSGLFSPAYKTITQALIYASGRLGLSLVLSIFLGLAFVLGVNLLGPGVPTLAIVAFLCLPALFAQVVWVAYLYRTKMGISGMFYIALLVIHAVLIAVLVPIFFSGEMKMAAVSFIDHSVAPRLVTAANAARHESAQAVADRDQVKNAADGLKSQISQDQADEKDLQKTIEDRKNSADYVFSWLVKQRARGDLTGARTGLVAFLKKFANDPRAEAAKGQLGEIDKALAEQTVQQKQQQAEADAATARARADLLARAAVGEVTLSEMRAALFGKTLAEVSALFGPPTETASDQWGYGQRMILDPETHAHYGLTVNFTDGVVQGVDYYYGAAR